MRSFLSPATACLARMAFLVCTTASVSCHAQSSNPVKDQQSAYKALDGMRRKAQNPASDGGWTMTCLIDGKPWKASGLYTPSIMGRIMGEYEDSRISFYDPGSYQEGAELNFEKYAVEFHPQHSNDIWSAHEGSMEITRVVNGWVEGKFHFNATVRGTSKKAVITDGFFRIALPRK